MIQDFEKWLARFHHWCRVQKYKPSYIAKKAVGTNVWESRVRARIERTRKEMERIDALMARIECEREAREKSE